MMSNVECCQQISVYNVIEGEIIHIKYLNAMTDERLGNDGFIGCNPNGPDQIKIAYFYLTTYRISNQSKYIVTCMK